MSYVYYGKSAVTQHLDIWSQVWLGSEQPNLVGDVPSYPSGGGLDNFLSSISTQCFYDSVI